MITLFTRLLTIRRLRKYSALNGALWVRGQVHSGELSCAFIRTNSTNTFPCTCNLGFPGIFIVTVCCSFSIESHCFIVYVYQRRPQTLTTFMQEHGYCDVFRVIAPGKIYPGFILLHSYFFKSQTYSIYYYMIAMYIRTLRIQPGMYNTHDNIRDFYVQKCNA